MNQSNPDPIVLCFLILARRGAEVRREQEQTKTNNGEDVNYDQN